MSQPARIPDRGDLPPRVVAQRLGMLLPDFEACRIELERRGFLSGIQRRAGIASRRWTGRACAAFRDCFES